MNRARFATLLLGASLLSAGCSDDFSPPSRLDRLRVLAVRADPGSGIPGRDTSLDMLLVDEDPNPELAPPREVDVLWAGGCHNPPERQFYGCYPLLRTFAAQLEDDASQTPAERFPPGTLGTGRSFSFTVPPDILERAPRIPTDPVHFGVSFVFFAACSGVLTPRPDLSDRVPLGCVDRQTRAPLPATEFVTGFSTVITYEGSTNENPRLEGVVIDGTPYTAGVACESDAACASLGRYVCSGAKQCVPAFDACPEEGDCAAHRIAPLVDPASAERLGDAHEIVWVNYYTTAGSFESDTQLVSDRATGLTDDPSGLWSPPRKPVGAARLWLTLNDQRGGAAWTSVDVEIRARATPE